MLIMTTRTDISPQSETMLCFSTNPDPNSNEQEKMCMVVVVGVLAEQASPSFVMLEDCYKCFQDISAALSAALISGPCLILVMLVLSYREQ